MIDRVPYTAQQPHRFPDNPGDAPVTVEETIALTRELLEKSRQTLQRVSATSARERNERFNRLRQRSSTPAE